MENLSGYTSTELLKIINDTKVEHDRIKQEIINHTFELEELEKVVNEKINLLGETEKLYVELIEELTSRNNAIR